MGPVWTRHHGSSHHLQVLLQQGLWNTGSVLAGHICGFLWFHVVSIVMACRGGYPKKWIVDIVDMENPIQLDDLGLPPISGNPHMSFNNIPEKSNLKFGVMCKIDETWPAIEVKPAISSVAITSLFYIGWSYLSYPDGCSLTCFTCRCSKIFER